MPGRTDGIVMVSGALHPDGVDGEVTEVDLARWLASEAARRLRALEPSIMPPPMVEMQWLAPPPVLPPRHTLPVVEHRCPADAATCRELSVSGRPSTYQPAPPGGPGAERSSGGEAAGASCGTCGWRPPANQVATGGNAETGADEAVDGTQTSTCGECGAALTTAVGSSDGIDPADGEAAGARARSPDDCATRCQVHGLLSETLLLSVGKLVYKAVEETNQHESVFAENELKRQAKAHAELVALGYDRRDMDDVIDRILHWHLARLVSRPVGKAVLNIGHAPGSTLLSAPPYDADLDAMTAALRRVFRRLLALFDFLLAASEHVASKHLVMHKGTFDALLRTLLGRTTRGVSRLNPGRQRKKRWAWRPDVEIHPHYAPSVAETDAIFEDVAVMVPLVT
eukprot:3606376-Pyramimonas_sp.AAC.1